MPRMIKRRREGTPMRVDRLPAKMHRMQINAAIIKYNSMCSLLSEYKISS